MEGRLPPKVLIVRLGAIGDVTNALVFASALAAQEPSPEIGWVVHELALPLVEGHPAVDRVHLWRRKSGLAGLRALVAELRRERYDIAVDLQRITKSALVARLSGAPRVLGYDRARAKEASWIWTREQIPRGDPRAHMVEQYLEFARYLGLADPPDRRELPPDAEADAWAAATVRALGGAPILLNVGASKPANRWLPERFGELAQGLQAALGAPIALIGGPNDAQAGARAMRAAAGAIGVHDLVGRTSLRQLCALTSHARLFVGCDTGPMHIAAACGTPVVALFGPADPTRTGPYGDGHRVVRELPPCAPCNRKHCNQSRHACMEDISVERVLDACCDALGATAGTR